MLINRPRIVQDPRHSERDLSKTRPRLRSQTVDLSHDARLDRTSIGNRRCYRRTNPALTIFLLVDVIPQPRNPRIDNPRYTGDACHGLLP
jgi:hypothetical protein